jgi:dTDP-4-dehydrorhamnose reductase
MILVLGADSYIGGIFCAELRRRGLDYLLPSGKDYSDFDSLFYCIRKSKPQFLINAASYPAADTDLSEMAREEILRVNTILPRFIAQVCLMTNTPWGHVSSCSIYSGAKIVVGTGIVVGKKLSRVELLRLVAECPEEIRGFTEADEPNFSFHATPCNFFSGTVALAEEAVRRIGRNYIWRLGLPFNERDEPENFLRQIQNTEKTYDGIRPLSHTGDFVRACLDLWERGAPFGIYNVANPGLVTFGRIMETVRKILNPPRHFEIAREEAGFYGHENDAPRSYCVLGVSKLLATGVAMRPVDEAIEDSLQNWRAAGFQDESHRVAA